MAREWFVECPFGKLACYLDEGNWCCPNCDFFIGDEEMQEDE